MEHYCTLFDHNFLPAGLCLHESLTQRGKPFRLWVLCMNKEVEAQLGWLGLENISPISLESIETPALLAVKAGRSVAEYCWTLTPFLPGWVLDREPTLPRVTYLDADLYFFADAAPIFAEFTQSGAHALITEHAYDPRFDQSATAGRFCVQFMVFRNTPEAKRILGWWQERCVEWCFSRHEEGKFGDQKYLDQWPALFGRDVHILADRCQALAPWNADFILKRMPNGFLPAFYHFHGLRIISSRSARLFTGYPLRRALPMYSQYIAALGRAAGILQAHRISLPYFPESVGLAESSRNFLRALRGKTRVAEIPY